MTRQDRIDRIADRAQQDRCLVRDLARITAESCERVGAGERQVTISPESLDSLKRRAYGAHRRHLVESL